MSKHQVEEKECTLRLNIRRLPEGVYLAASRSFPGLVAQGGSIEETVEIARDVARKLIESYRDHGRHLPATLKQAGNRFTVDTAFAV